MGNSFTMKVIDGEKKRRHYSRSFLFRKLFPILSQFVEEHSTLAVLHDQIEVVGRLVRLVILDHVRMVEGG